MGTTDFPRKVKKRVYAIRAHHGEPIGVVGEIDSALETLRAELEAIAVNDNAEYEVFALSMSEDEIDRLPEL